jgi:hypothetical protein
MCEGAPVGNAHRGICQIAEHSAMKRLHRIRVSPASFEIDRGSTCLATCDHQTQKLADWSGKFFWRHIWALFAAARKIHRAMRRVFRKIARKYRFRLIAKSPKTIHSNASRCRAGRNPERGEIYRSLAPRAAPACRPRCCNKRPHLTRSAKGRKAISD